MYMRLFRLLWRLLTLAIVVAATYVTAFLVLPYLDHQLPLVWAILVAYLALAYGLLPIASRFWRIVFKPNHIPRYVTTPDGWPADPVNIAIVAKNKRQLVAAMSKAGWYQADRSNLTNTLHEAYAIVFNKNYLTAPFSAFYLFGRKFDIGFQMPIEGKAAPRHRHHVRFWQVRDEPAIDTKNHFEYWLQRLKRFFSRRQKVWIGAAIQDVRPIGLRWRNLQITHHSGRHIDDRDLIIRSLKDTGIVKSVHTITDGEPFRMRTQNVSTSFIVDGTIKVVTLKNRIRKEVK